MAISDENVYYLVEFYYLVRFIFLQLNQLDHF